MKLPTVNNHAPKILIVEDDFIFALELEILIQEAGYELLGKVDNSGEALDLILGKEPDLILMDIDIKGHLSGVEIAQKITHLNVPILFITSHDDEATYQEASQTNIVNYLVKPVHSITLKFSILNAIAQTSQKAPPMEEENHISSEEPELFIKNALFFKKKDFFFKVNYSEILYIQAEDKYCTTYTDKGEKFMVRVSLSNFEEWLPNNDFMRISRSYIIPLEKINKINTKDISVHIGEKELLMSQNKFLELQKLMFKVK